MADPPGGKCAEAWACAVWRYPLRPELRGARCGGGEAWSALAATLPGVRYIFASGARLRRFASEQSAAAGAEEFEWELRVAELTDDYQPLQVDVSVVHQGLASDGGGIMVPIAPINKARGVPTLALHQMSASLLPSGDGQLATVAFVRANAEGGSWLGPASGSSRWAGGGRWPAARALVQLAAALPAAVLEADIDPERGCSCALAPAAHALSPEDLDTVLGGALGAGPRAAQVAPPRLRRAGGLRAPPLATWLGVADARVARLQGPAAAAARAAMLAAKSAAHGSARQRAPRSCMSSPGDDEESRVENRRSAPRQRQPAGAGRATVATPAAMLERLESSNQDVLRRMVALGTSGAPARAAARPGGAGAAPAEAGAAGSLAAAPPWPGQGPRAAAPAHPQVLGAPQAGGADQAAVAWALGGAGPPRLARFGQAVGAAGARPAATAAAPLRFGPSAAAAAALGRAAPLDAMQVAQARANFARRHGVQLADGVRRSPEGIAACRRDAWQAGRALLRRDLLARPAAWSAIIRANAEQALAGANDDPDPRARSLVEFVARTGAINRGDRTAANMGFGLARVADLMARGQREMAEAVILLWQLALLLARLPEPLWTQMAAGASGSVGCLRPFAHLAEPAWTTAAMGYAKDAASLAEIRRTFNDDRGNAARPKKDEEEQRPPQSPKKGAGAGHGKEEAGQAGVPRAQIGVVRRLLQVNLMVVACSFLALGSTRWCPASCRTGMGLTDLQRDRLPHLLALAKQWNRAPYHVSGRGEMTRATFCKQEARFVPVYHLPVFEAAAYLDPGLIERGQPLGHGLNPMWQAGSSSEIVAFASDLDRSRKLYLASPDEVNLKQACKLIPVLREQHRDRIVWDRRTRNAAEHALQSGSQRLVPGHALCEYELQDDAEPVLFAEDVSDFYPAFDAPPARARTDVLARNVQTHLLQHARAYANRRAELGERCVVCVASLRMGDLSAIDFALGAREAVLQAGGSLADVVRVQHHRHFPRGPLAELLQIDDRVGLGQRARGSRRLPLSLVHSFAGAREQCDKVGLRVAGDKSVAGASAGFALGAELVPSGHIGAEGLRRAGLILLSCGIAAHGIATWNPAQKDGG
ncbi:unnamed protein product [Prorocentrum cordatum]|uniref:Uncharacterized protein n=1 Tax=Prorocentrum cordatum TaxID=2364126 RepID=A0ABN9W3M0_9DINO|nr:unnamed protein product [Polarella glacialis]